MSTSTHALRSGFDGLTFAYLAMLAIVAVVAPDEAAMLDLNRNALLFFGLMIAGMIVSFALNRGGVRTLGHMIFAPAYERLPTGAPKPFLKTFWGAQTVLLLVATFVASIIATEASLIPLLDRERIEPAMRLLGSLFHPAWELLPKAVVAMVQTVYIAFLATAFAVPLAFVLSFLGAKNIMGKSKRGFAIYMALRVLFNVSRAVEPIIWAIIFSLWVGFGPFAGMLALMIHSIASLAKQYSEYVEGVEDGPIEGIRSTGANTLQTIWFAIVPQVVLNYISYTIYRWDTNVRLATIIGFVGGGGIGKLLIEYQLQGAWPQVGCILVVIAFVVWAMDAFSAYVREAVK